MQRLGLALSGGGFRASLFHLGLVRFLRDADLLRAVTHITSVSGGSIVAAHLVLNWARYSGSPQEFEAAAAEIVNFVRLDVRNRILRRFPLTLPLRAGCRLLRRNARQLTRSGLLEWHYEKYLYGDRALFELPENPQLHILATNLSEGCICSFHRHGLLVQKRLPGRAFRFDRIAAGLATVPMAVTASSAFPGFFPPMELTGAEIGANEGDLSRQSFTDGGIFDNLGVRMFRCLEESWKAQSGREDSNDGVAGVLVSDAGKRFKVVGQQRPVGLLRTAVRATDIVMDRVWQLENETCADAPGFVFARISDVVEPAEDADALHAEVQRHTANIRTDMDRFSELEISSLVRHGYSVARKACRRRPDLFGEALPAGGPWDPTGLDRTDVAKMHLTANSDPHLPARPATEAMANSRALQKSAGRRLWSTLLDHRDWVSYLYLPLLLSIFVLLPYVAVKMYQRSQRINLLVESLAQGGPEFREMSRLFEDGPEKPWKGVDAEEVLALDEPDFTGYEVLQDSRIIDMRPWKPARKSEASLACATCGSSSTPKARGTIPSGSAC